MMHHVYWIEVYFSDANIVLFINVLFITLILFAHNVVVISLIGMTMQEAEVLGNKDKQRLLQSQKLALVVDLDQTLIHTSMDPNIESGLPVSWGE